MPSAFTIITATTTTLTIIIIVSLIIIMSSSTSSGPAVSALPSEEIDLTLEDDTNTAAFPGTADQRRNTIIEKVQSLSEKDLVDNWQNIRSKLLAAAGLKETRQTSHIFNDWNHCDITPMKTQTFDFENEGRVQGMHPRNPLGEVIRANSMVNGEGGFDDKDGSWGTCMMGCNKNPPRDVAHIQFKAKIAFKLAWLPPTFDKFVLLSDAGEVMKVGENLDKNFPAMRERQGNFETIRGATSRYMKNLLKFIK